MKMDLEEARGSGAKAMRGGVSPIDLSFYEAEQRNSDAGRRPFSVEKTGLGQQGERDRL